MIKMRNIIKYPLQAPFKKKDGFTLIEVLLAIGLLTVGLLTIASMQVTAIKGNASARRQTERSTWAQDKMEELMSLNYDHADLDEDASPHTEVNPPTGYTITWDVVDDIPVTNSKLITVTVNALGKTDVLTCVKPAF